MVRLIVLSLALIFIAGNADGSTGLQKKDYFTEDELDLIRDAQELNLRVAAYFNLAERRLIILGLTDKSDKQKEKERKAQEKYEKDKKKAGDKALKVEPQEDELDYLHDFTRSELFRGYLQAIEEVMDNVDDHYSRKLDVRNALESIEKFTRETLLGLEKFQPKNATETKALEDAREKAREANRGAKEAMKTVPKTEKKTKPDGR